jgi:hypothetical protein
MFFIFIPTLWITNIKNKPKPSKHLPPIFGFDPCVDKLAIIRIVCMNKDPRDRFLISPPGVKSDLQGWSWPLRGTLSPTGEVIPGGLLAPPFSKQQCPLTPKGEGRGEHPPKDAEFIPGAKLTPRGKLILSKIRPLATYCRSWNPAVWRWRIGIASTRNKLWPGKTNIGDVRCHLWRGKRCANSGNRCRSYQTRFFPILQIFVRLSYQYLC